MKKIKLKFLYWLYYILGVRNVRSAYDLLQSDNDMFMQYGRLVNALEETGLCTKYLRFVARYYLTAIIIKSSEIISGKRFILDNIDFSDLKKIIEYSVGSISIYNGGVYILKTDEDFDFDPEKKYKLSIEFQTLYSMAKLMLHRLFNLEV